MNACRWSVILLCAILVLFNHGVSAESEVQKSPKVGSLTALAVGDSITEGKAGFPTYRQFLAPKLESYGVRFIGPKRDKYSAHAGFSGKDSSFLLARLPKIYAEYPADWVLIHSGHNHFARDQPVPLILKNKEAMIRALHEANPKVVVFLAQVIPSGKLPKYGYIAELNRELAGLAKRLDGEGGAVVLVDLATDFKWKEDAREDRVHPNEQGAKKMASGWWKFMDGRLEKKD